MEYDEAPNPFGEDSEGPYEATPSPSISRVDLTSSSDSNGDDGLDSSHSTLNNREPARAAASTSSPPIAPAQLPPPAGYKNDIDRYLHSGDEVEVQVRRCGAAWRVRLLTHCSQITEALKTSENSSSPYIVYVIQTGVRFLI